MKASMNGIMLFKHKSIWQSIPREAAKILHQDIFWFFLWDKDFVCRTITEGSVDLDKFPTSRVWQLAKKLESSKATVSHIKQVAGDPQVAQISLLKHQRTELQTTRHNKKRRPVSKQRQPQHKIPENQVTGQVKKHYDNKIVHKNIDAISVVTQLMYRGLTSLPRTTNVKCAINMVIFQVSVTRRRTKLNTRAG